MRDPATDLHLRTAQLHREHFGASPSVAAYAPGRVEVLGNHTDYNEGFVLSAAIDMGTCFALSPADGTAARVFSANLKQETTFETASPQRDSAAPWADYIKGVIAALSRIEGAIPSFRATVNGDLPLGAGLSSSAALEVASAIAIARLRDVTVDPPDMAAICASAECEFVGSHCGLLDQITILYARRDTLLRTDFRTLKILHVAFPEEVCFVQCDTGVRHVLPGSGYNQRRAECEKAIDWFNARIEKSVKSLRDVTLADWRAHSETMDPVLARRAQHVIEENLRVQNAAELLRGGKLEEFGELMTASHESSRTLFENSCPELDRTVGEALKVPGVIGARLSGGGFGGSVIALTYTRDAETVTRVLSEFCRREFGEKAGARMLRTADAARMVRAGLT